MHRYINTPCTCAQCGIVFLVYNHIRKFCTNDCRNAYKKEHPNKNPKPREAFDKSSRICEHCGIEYIPVWRPQRYCSGTCQYAVRVGVYKNPLSVCQHCGKEYRPKYSNRVTYCSRECARLHVTNPNKTRTLTDAERVARHRYRERRVSGVHSPRETITRRDIYARDKGLCGICGKKVDRALVHPDPGSLTLDHILPLAQGGRHERSNVRLAHFLCNSKRADKATNDQLRMLG